MDLFFAPMACSMAPRIVCYETRTTMRFLRADLGTKRIDEGDLRSVSPLGQVPALRLADGTVLLENVAILMFLAERSASSPLAPRDMLDRAKQLRWLCYVNAELHALVFHHLLTTSSPEVRSKVLVELKPRMEMLDQHLANREFLLDRFTAADAYLFVVLNWCKAASVTIDDWPLLSGYHLKLSQRPTIAKAVSEERAMYGKPL